MGQIAEFLADYVIEKGTVKEEERGVYEYGFLVALEKALCLITCFVISIALHTIPECILFFVIFIPLRSYAGGLHLDNYWSCFSLSCLTFLVIMIMGKYLEISLFVSSVALLFLELIIYKMYPVENANRVVDSDEDKQFRKRLKQFLVVDGIIAVICVLLGQYVYLQTITMTFFMVAATMVIGKYRNKRQL